MADGQAPGGKGAQGVWARAGGGVWTPLQLELGAGLSGREEGAWCTPVLKAGPLG